MTEYNELKAIINLKLDAVKKIRQGSDTEEIKSHGQKGELENLEDLCESLHKKYAEIERTPITESSYRLLKDYYESRVRPLFYDLHEEAASGEIEAIIAKIDKAKTSMSAGSPHLFAPRAVDSHILVARERVYGKLYGCFKRRMRDIYDPRERGLLEDRKDNSKAETLLNSIEEEIKKIEETTLKAPDKNFKRYQKLGAYYEETLSKLDRSLYLEKQLEELNSLLDQYECKLVGAPAPEAPRGSV